MTTRTHTRPQGRAAHTPRLRLLVAAAAALLVAACASQPTPYQSAIDHRYGFADQQLEANRYRVSFSGNSATSRETVENYLLFRAAEITLDSGHDYFVMLEGDTDRHTRYRTVYDRSWGWSPWVGYGYGCCRSGFYGGFTTGYTTPIDRYDATATFLVFRGIKPADDAFAYDARDVVRRLGPTVIWPKQTAAG